MGCVQLACSELALMRQRVRVEVEWLLCLSEYAPHIGLHIPTLDTLAKDYLRSLYLNFDVYDGNDVKSIEKTTNHDVKSIEYYIRDKLQLLLTDNTQTYNNIPTTTTINKTTTNNKMLLSSLPKSSQQSLSQCIEYIHFGCTSEDINNLSYALMLKESTEQILRPAMKQMQLNIRQLAIQHADDALLSRTHGQPATPTTFGKEMANFASRMHRHITRGIDQLEYLGKFNGAVGNFNAHHICCPTADWESVARTLVQDRLCLKYQPYSTQIESGDFIAEWCDVVMRYNNTLTDFNVDMWTYISRDLLKLRVVSTEVGSSTMPHKVNPIDFENSEGNLRLANGILKTISCSIPISRLQRDLSGSTVLRNIGLCVGYTVHALNSCAKGIGKITVHTQNMHDELERNWAVLAEPIQMMLRKYKDDAPYETLKKLTRGSSSDEQKRALQHFLCELVDGRGTVQLNDQDKQTLRVMTPHTYTGYANRLATTVPCVD
eukprot:GHVS01031511.1.p1 GENE.GHVS01031511.1~~GHVS01031511.1.p1  ORF type:complete len:490 (+),score=54.58 GHVS01031511.1:312-1781(+)